MQKYFLFSTLLALLFTSSLFAQDLTPPSASCQDVTVQLDVNGQVSLSPSDIDNGSTDNVTPAGNLSFALSPNTFDCSAVGKLPAWAALGGVGISAGKAIYQSLSIAPDGTPYVAYRDFANGQKTTVLRWDGSAWAALGGAGISAGEADNQSLAIAPDGTPYVAYRDEANGRKTTVLKWDGSAWIALGGAGISAGMVYYQSLAIAPDGTPYVAYQDFANGGGKTTVLRWDGSAWAALGGAGISAGIAFYQSLAIAPDGTPYVAYEDFANDDKTTVLRWDGSAWIALGGAGISAGTAFYQSLAIAPDGTPYVAYRDDDIGGKTTVLRWDGSAWAALGGAGISAGAATSQSLAIAPNGTPYVAYRDVTNGDKTTVLRWDGSAWAALGGAGISAGAATSQSLAIAPDGTPYVAYRDDANGRKTTVLQWDGDNFATLSVTDAAGNSSQCRAWVTVEDDTPPTALCQDLTVQLAASGQASILPSQVDNGSFDNCGSISSLSLSLSTFDCSAVGKQPAWVAPGGAGISAGRAIFQSLAIAPDGTPYVAYSDDVNGDKTTVLRWDGSAWIALGGAGISAGDKPYPSLAVAPDGTPYVAYEDDDNDEKTTVLRWDGSAWVALGGAGISAGEAEYQSLAIAPDGTPYVAYEDWANNEKTTVLRWDGSAWIALGGAGISAGEADNQSLAIASDGTPYVAYSDDVSSHKTTVLKWDGSAWAALGGAGIPARFAQHQSLAIAPDGTPYVAYQDFANGGKTTVLRWDGSAWAALGGAGISAGEAEYQSLAIAPDGTPYVAYLDEANGLKTTVLRWDGSAWIALGGTGISAGSALYQSLAIAPDGTPYVAYKDDANDEKTTVLSWDGDNFATLSVTDAAGNSSQCRAWVTVEDDTSPTALCQDLTVQLDASGQASILPSQVDNGSSDNCSISLAVSPNNFGCADVGSQQVTLTVTDGSGNTAQCTAHVQVDGPILPALAPQNCGSCNEIRFTLCQFDPAPMLEQEIMLGNMNYVSGSSLEWYADNAGNLGAALPGPPTVDNSSAATQYYQIVQTQSGCSSPPRRVRVRVKRLFIPTFNLPSLGCGGSNLLNLALYVGDPRNKATAYTFYDVDPAANPTASPLGSVNATKGVVDFGQILNVSVPAGGQTYWVQISVPNGCNGIASSTVSSPSNAATLAPIPHLTVQAGDPVNISFTGSNATQFVWYNFGNPSIGILGMAGLNSLSFTAQNSGSTPLTVNIMVIAYNGGCAGQVSSFSITVNPGGPIRQGSQLLSLSASAINAHDVQLRWQFASEWEVLRFEVEKKRDGENVGNVGNVEDVMKGWETLGSVDGTGNGEYAYLDASGMSNLNRYRLKVILADGRVVWSETVKVNMDFVDNHRFDLFPNPTAGQFQIKALFPMEEAYNWQLTDVMGKTLMQGEMEEQQTSIQVESLATGVYHLVMISPEGKRYLMKVMKQ